MSEIEKFQWIKGDHIGTVEEVKEEIDEWTTFKSGRRIATNLLTEFMTPIESEFVDIESRPVNKQPGKQPAKRRHTQDIGMDSAVMLLLKNMKNLKEETISVDIKVKLPNEDKYNLLIDSFDDANKEIIKFIIGQINSESIIKAIEEKINEKYNS